MVAPGHKLCYVLFFSQLFGLVLNVLKMWRDKKNCNGAEFLKNVDFLFFFKDFF